MRKLYKSLKQALLHLSDVAIEGLHFYGSNFLAPLYKMRNLNKANLAANFVTGSRFFISFLSQLKKVQTL